MELKDFRNYVNNSDFRDKLNELEVSINLEHLNYSITFKGIQSIYKFVRRQIIGWNNFESLPDELNSSKHHFEHLRSQIIELVTNQSYFIANNFAIKWEEIVSLLNSSNSSNNRRYSVFIYDSPITDFIINLNNHNNQYSKSALDYITKRPLNMNNSKDYLNGVLLAYEFTHQTNNDIVQRRQNEKRSIAQITNKFEEQLVEAEQHLNNYLSDTKDNLIKHFDTVEILKNEKGKLFEEWFKLTGEEFDVFYNNAKESITSNEDLYREKLRLEAPAEYWKKRALKLHSESKDYLDWLIRISLFGTMLLFVILISLGSNFYANIFSDNVKGIKWSLILITIVSLIVFIIRILAKLYMSTLHLSRDAEEREQLTHFYLALKKDTAIESEERHLILQSLFSRADTGLLKEDSSPTMPSNSIIDKFTGR